MVKMINLTIDDLAVTVPAGTLIVDAAKQVGNDIPVFCYHPKMEPVGMCRMCLVEIGRPAVDRATGSPQLNPDGTPVIQFGPKLDTACTTPVSEGMVVRTQTTQVVDARRGMLEFLLTSHPLDCPICDKGGECPLQNLTIAYGPGASRFLLDDKKQLAKHLPLSDLIMLDRERCIQCARCVRFQSDLAGDPVIGLTQRGRSFQIVTYSDPGFDSVFSGDTTDICPVGALTTVDFRFGARPWELKPVASICTQCPVGCNLTLNVRREAVTGGKSVVKRVLPRQNEGVNEIWICDKGRFAYHFAESPERLTQPMIRRNSDFVKATWDEALDVIAQKVRARDQARGVVAVAGGSLPNEDLFTLKRFAEELGGQAVQYTHMAGGEWTTRYGLPQGSNLGDLGAGSAVIVVASDLYQEAPVWVLRLRAAAKRGAKLIVINARETKLDLAATTILRHAYGEEIATLQQLLPGGSQAALLNDIENLVIFFGSDGLGLDGTGALAENCAFLLAETGHTGKVNNGLVGVWSHANHQGAWEMGIHPAQDLAERMAGAGVLYIAAADPAGEDAALAHSIESAGFVVVQELFMTATAKLADVVLPAQSFIEREGTFTTSERLVQRFYPAVMPAANGARADYAILAALAQRLELALEARVPSLIMLQMAETYPAFAGMTYPKISAVHPQLPIVGREDLYYGGTGYGNKQGLGAHLAALTPESTPTAAVAQPIAKAQAGELWVVPITRLYDQGNTVRPSMILQAHLAQAEIWVNSATAANVSLAQAEAVQLTPGGTTVRVRLDESVPDGVALAPRSVGIPLDQPMVVKLTRAAAAAAD